MVSSIVCPTDCAIRCRSVWVWAVLGFVRSGVLVS